MRCGGETTVRSRGGWHSSRRSPSLAALPWGRIRVVVFDVDGTLYDQRSLRHRMRLALAAHCLMRPRDLMMWRTLQTFRRTREALAEQAHEGISRLQYELPAALLELSPNTVERAVQTWMHERPLLYLRQCRYPGVERVFKVLRSSGRTIAIFSDYPAQAKLWALGLRADLHVAASDPDVERLKPHTLGLQRVLERVGAGPEECLYIGDRDERDGECARRLGVHFLLKSRAATTQARAFYRYNDLLPCLELPLLEPTL